MTYVEFLLLFLVGPSLLLVPLIGPLHLRRALVVAVAAAAAMAIVSLPLARGLAFHIRSYADGRVGPGVFGVPFEGCFFFVLQAVFVSLLTMAALRRSWWRR